MGSNSTRGLGPAALLCLSLMTIGVHGAAVDSRPNIIFILADDYGFHDIGYHHSRIRTPNLDKLAAEGVKLENYYVQPICTPTRSQLMSGRYQIHTGLQHGVIHPNVPNGLPLNSPTMAKVLKDSGYSTHMVGKWHLGFYKKDYLPNNRGFDSFYGYLTGAEDYFTHKRSGYLDLHDNLVPDFNQTGRYSADIFTNKAMDIVHKQTSSPSKNPFFLYLAYQSVHAPLEVPAKYKDQYKDIHDVNRRNYAGMVTCMDEGIGNLTAALKNAGLMDNTVIVFSTDNGGQVLAGGNNYPLRGWKGSLWEGGVHGLGFVHSPLLKQKGYVNKRLIHVSDWFPTLVGLAHGSLNGTLPLDGFDQWKAISENAPSARHELLHNIDPLQKPVGKRLYPDTFDTRVRAAIRVGDYKLITGDPGNGTWVPPPDVANVDQYEDTYDDYADQYRYFEDSIDDHNSVLNAAGTVRERHSGVQKMEIDKSVVWEREQSAGDRLAVEGSSLTELRAVQKNVWLFNITADPEERRDLSDSKPTVVKHMLDRLKFYQSTAVPCRYPRRDPRSNPSRHGGVWGPWE